MALRQLSEAEFQTEVLGGEGLVLVDFYASWCPPCRALAPLLERFAEQHKEKLTIVKIDSDVEEGLAEQLSVRTIPTVIAFRDGQEIARAVNPQSRARLEELAGVS